MQQDLITKQMVLLQKGKLCAKGYSTQMNFIYDKKQVRGSLKEWDFYQIICGSKVLQFTVGHITRFGQISVNIIDLDTGEKRGVDKIFLNTSVLKKQLAQTPERPNVIKWFGRHLKMQIKNSEQSRRLTLSANDKNGLRAEIDVTLTNCSPSKDKMVIATPFEKPTQWYLNYKENCFVANGYARVDDLEMKIVDGNGLIDWGRGVWPRKHEWVWGNGSTMVDGKHFGFNIGWGFGDLSHATENMFFLDNKAYKLGEVEETRVGDVYRYTDKEHKFTFNVTPIFDNFTHTKAPTVNNTCHQVFGTWRGFVTLPNGKTIEIPPFIAFCEHAKNNW